MLLRQILESNKQVKESHKVYKKISLIPSSSANLRVN
jgi:hypothetical protein